MTAVVDLVAVAHARTALRALVTAHPELTAPAAQERAGRWLADLEVNMSRKLSIEEDSVQLGIRLPRSLLSALDVEVLRLAAQVPPELRSVVNITRSDAVRTILQRALATPATSAPPASAPVASSVDTTGISDTAKGTDALEVVHAALARAADGAKLVHLPDLAALVPELAPSVVRDALLRLDAARRIELRPWSGVTALTPAQREWCPPGHDGAPLGVARMLAPVALVDQVHADKPAAADLRARFEAAAAADPKRVNNNAAGRALETSEARIRRWRKGEGELPREFANPLAAWLKREGF